MSLQLTEEQAELLTQILAEQWVRGSQGIPEGYRREDWERRNEDELRAVLSQNQIDSFRRYKETAGTREEVAALRAELLASSHPLRDDQINRLIDALYPEEKRLMEEARSFNESLDTTPAALADSERSAERYFAERETAAVERKLAAAGAILSSEQLTVLRRRLEGQQAMGQSGSRLRRLQFELATSLGRDSGAGTPAN